MRWTLLRKLVNHFDYLFGLAKKCRLIAILGRELCEAQCEHQRTGQAARVFKDFTYRTRTSWSRARRVVGKAEHLHPGANPRFVVTSLSAAEFAAPVLYEQEYCARSDMENRIQEQQLCLFADRTSSVPRLYDLSWGEWWTFGALASSYH